MSNREIDDAYWVLNRSLDVAVLYLEKDGALLSLPDVAKLRETTPQQVAAKLRALKRKPDFVVFGGADVGKSTLLNFLIAESILPTGPRPVSRVPIWLKEDYWSNRKMPRPEFLVGDDKYFLLKASIDLSRWDDETYLGPLIEKAMSREKMYDEAAHTFVTRVNERRRDADYQPAHQKLIVGFETNAFLKVADLADLPGVGGTESDSHRAFSFVDRRSSHLGPINVGIYCSAATVNFMSGADYSAIARLIENLDCLSEDESSPLSNLLIVATKANPAEFSSASKMNNMLSQASEELAFHLCDEIPDELLKRYRHIKKPINRGQLREALTQDLRDCMVPFWLDDPTPGRSSWRGEIKTNDDRSSSVKRRVLNLATEKWPKIFSTRFLAAVDTLRAETIGRTNEAIADLFTTLKNVGTAAKALEEIEKAEPERLRRFDNLRSQIRARIAEARERCRTALDGIVAKYETKEGMTRFLESYYANTGDDKERAKKGATSLLMRDIEKSASSCIEKETNVIREFLERELRGVINSSLVADLGQEMLVSEMPIHLKRMVLGTVVGGVAGPLLGIMVGIPVLWPAIVIGAIIAGAWAIWDALFGDWRSTMAKQFVKTLSESSIRIKMASANDGYWGRCQDDCLTVVDKADTEFRAYCDNLRKIATGDPEETRRQLEEAIEKMKILSDFFDGWVYSEVS